MSCCRMTWILTWLLGCKPHRITIFHIFAHEKNYIITMELSEQEIIRRKKLEDLNNLGINPYPADTYEVNTTSSEIHTRFPEDPDRFQAGSLAGRIMKQRIMGAVSFYEIQDAFGKIQIYV